MPKITENNTEFYAFNTDKPKKTSGFYNPKMKFNRDITILLLKTFSRNEMNIALPLAATGIRGLRLFKELNKDQIQKIHFNDLNKESVKLIKKNIEHNEIPKNKYTISNKESDLFILEQTGLDYIDIDPYGTPLKFLDAAIKRMKSDSIIAITATDLAALTSNEKACKRKHDSKPLNNELKHEIGLRILIRKVQLIGTLYNKALAPLLSFYKDHYYRVFFKVLINNKDECNKLLERHLYFLYCDKCLNRKVSELNSGVCGCGNKFSFCGKMFVGELFDKDLVKKMHDINKNKELIDFLQIVSQESKQNIVGFYEMSKINKIYKLKNVKMNDLIKLNNAHRTHFSVEGFKCKKLRIKN